MFDLENGSLGLRGGSGAYSVSAYGLGGRALGEGSCGGDQKEAWGGTGTCGGGRQSEPRQLPWVRCPQLGWGVTLDKAPVQLRPGWLWLMPRAPPPDRPSDLLSPDQSVQTPVSRVWPRPPPLPTARDRRCGLRHPHPSWRPPAQGQLCRDIRDRLTRRTHSGISKFVNFRQGLFWKNGNAGVPRSLGV